MSVKLDVKTDRQVVSLQVEKGQNLLQILRENDISITSPCSGNKTCGKCKIKVLSGQVPLTNSELDLLTEEEVDNRYRLACFINMLEDISIELVEEGQIETVSGSMGFDFDFNPVLGTTEWDNDQDQKELDLSYLDLIERSIGTDQLNLSVLKQLSQLTTGNKMSLLYYYNNIIAVKKESFNKIYGLAVDIGTTTVAVYLMNLLTGEEVDVESFHNPQKKFGADVISRINYARSADGAVKEIQDAIIDGINQAISNLLYRDSINKNDVYIVTVVGNTTMLHFLLGVNPQSIARVPYRPVFTNLFELPADNLNLNINPDGIIQILPSVSAYVGSDIVADLLISDFDTEDWNLLIDIGTNGEMALGNKNRILTCSTAAGPAFEGANITYGMAGVPGAISRFSISGEKQFLYDTIGSKKAVGICGSGLIDIVAEMLEHNILTGSGSFNSEMEKIFENKLTTYKNIRALKISERETAAIDSHILLTQKDIRELQLAKGAIAAGINILLKEAGIGYNDIENIYLAGGFGSFINSENACKIGLLPKNMEGKIKKIGNGAGLGARVYMLDKNQREKVEVLVDKIEYLELSLRKDFQDEFMMSMEF